MFTVLTCDLNQSQELSGTCRCGETLLGSLSDACRECTCTHGIIYVILEHKPPPPNVPS